MEDKFKASSGWLENFKHRVGIRKGKYIGRDPWPDASESEGEESSVKHDQRMIWQPDSSLSSEHGGKDASDELTTESQASAAGEAKGCEAPPAMSGHTALVQPISPTLDQGNERSFDQASAQSQTSSDRPASRQDGRRVGMRKTRSRTLAEAREAEASLSNGLAYPPALASPSATLAASSSPAENVEPNARGSAHDPIAKLPQALSSPTPTSSAVVTLSDGREASAGLDAALDFIGSQPQGFATPEEVAVLQKLSRRMSRAELPRNHGSSSVPTTWKGTGEA